MVTEVKPMEIKKTQTQTQPVVTSVKDKEAALSAWKPKEFIEEIKDELSKITWTSPEELKAYTQIVVGATFAFGMGIYILDLLIQGVLNGLASAVHLIAG
jgi:preprotein translocase subunit SecE